MAKHLIDSDIYIDFLQSGRFHTEIARIYAEHTPGIYFSAVVIEELLAGAISPAERKNVEILYLPFERAGRIVTPPIRTGGKQEIFSLGFFVSSLLTAQSFLTSLPIV